MIRTLTPNQMIKDLWCGIITKFKHNMLEHSVELDIKVIDSDIEKNYKVFFLQILSLEIFYEYPENFWEYVELTEIEVEKENECYKIECDFWSTGGMKLLCRTIIINGAYLEA